MDMKNIDRIMVQWNRFVKIKNKNYLDDYVFIKEIGMGTFGVVAKIQMKYGGLFKAAKIIKMAMFDQKKNKKEKFMTEITISMKIDHPNINKLFEVY
jgi:serine/threonine protein kinase